MCASEKVSEEGIAWMSESEKEWKCEKTSFCNVKFADIKGWWRVKLSDILQTRFYFIQMNILVNSI